MTTKAAVLFGDLGLGLGWRLHLTLRTEAASNTVVLTDLGMLGVGAGVHTGRATFLVLHVEGACLGCKKTRKEDHIKSGPIYQLDNAMMGR